MDQAPTENSTFSLFLQENMYEFFKDITDVAKVLQVYSENDAILGRGEFWYSNQQYLNEISDSCSLSEGIAITEYNLHGGDVKK